MIKRSKACRRSARLWWFPVVLWLVATARPSVVQAAEAEELRSFTPGQARTLLSVARDLFPQPELRDGDFQRCLAEVDAAVRVEDKAAIADAMSMVEGALRRMGYQAYEDISDEDERVRMARMLAEGRWMRGYRQSMEQCLAQPSGQ